MRGWYLSALTAAIAIATNWIDLTWGDPIWPQFNRWCIVFAVILFVASLWRAQAQRG